MQQSPGPGAVITHVNRKFNLVAHNLSKRALQLDAELSWMEETPYNGDSQN